MFFIFQGRYLIFTPIQIGVIILVRMFFLRKEEIVESFSLLILLYIGNLLEYHYIIIHYFEYILLLFFLVFLIYNIYSSSSTKKVTETIIIILGVVIFLSINFYNSNNRLFKDPQLHKTVSTKYESKFIGEESNLREVDERLNRIEHLDIGNKWSIRSLDGIENLSNLKDLDISSQYKLIDYSNLKQLDNLEVLFISDPHIDFNINILPELNKLRRIYISLYGDQMLNDKIIDLKNLPNLNSFSFTSTYKDNPLTIDISKAHNVESINVLGNVQEIIGLKEAKNLKEVRIYPDEMNYLEEIKKLRPDIDIK